MTFTLKWIPALDTAFNPSTHLVAGVNDLAAQSAVISQQAGEAAVLKAVVEHPGIGLLNDASRRYILLCWDEGGGRVLFRGRLVGFPDSLTARQVTLEFHASPEDLDDQLVAFHEAAKSDPARWDDLTVAPADRADPTKGLQARAARYDVDRVTHAIDYAPLIASGSVTFDDPVVDRDSLDVSLGTRPPRRVLVRLTAEWEQAAAGITNLTGKLKQAFGGLITNHATEEEMFAEWPAIGPLDDSGWTIVKSQLYSKGRDASLPRGHLLRFAGEDWYTKHPFLFATPADGLLARYDYRQTRREVVEVVVTAGLQPIYAIDGPDKPIEITLQPLIEGDAPPWAPEQTVTSGELRSWGAGIYQALRDHITGDDFKVLPPELAYNPDSPEIAALDPDWQQVTAAGFALGDTVRDRFFDTDRGLQVIDHAIAIGLAQMKELAACITVTGTGSLDALWAINCRSSMRLAGTALVLADELTGQVRDYEIHVNDPEGEAWVSFTLACVPGTGTSQPTASAGAEPYMASGYVAQGYVAEALPTSTVPGYQLTATDGLAYQFASSSDAVTTPVKAYALGQPDYAITELTVQHSGLQQNAEAANYRSFRVKAFSLTNNGYVVLADYVDHQPAKPRIYLRLRQLTGHAPLERSLSVTVDAWQAPRQIDLE